MKRAIPAPIIPGNEQDWGRDFVGGEDREINSRRLKCSLVRF
jgi:hypothetical protein